MPEARGNGGSGGKRTKTAVGAWVGMRLDWRARMRVYASAPRHRGFWPRRFPPTTLQPAPTAPPRRDQIRNAGQQRCERDRHRRRSTGKASKIDCDDLNLALDPWTVDRVRVQDFLRSRFFFFLCSSITTLLCRLLRIFLRKGRNHSLRSLLGKAHIKVLAVNIFIVPNDKNFQLILRNIIITVLINDCSCRFPIRYETSKRNILQDLFHRDAFVWRDVCDVFSRNNFEHFLRGHGEEHRVHSRRRFSHFELLVYSVTL